MDRSKIELRVDAEWVLAIDTALKRMGQPSANQRTVRNTLDLRCPKEWLVTVDEALHDLGLTTRAEFVRMATLLWIRKELRKTPLPQYGFSSRSAVIRLAVMQWIAEQ